MKILGLSVLTATDDAATVQAAGRFATAARRCGVRSVVDARATRLRSKLRAADDWAFLAIVGPENVAACTIQLRFRGEHTREEEVLPVTVALRDLVEVCAPELDEGALRAAQLWLDSGATTT